MYIQFIGTQAGLPGKFRNPSSLILDLSEEVRGGEMIMIDCGEGTQTRIIRQEDKIKNGSKPNLNKITKIFITHKHFDHIGGLIGLLMTANSLGRKEKLEIYGPKGLNQWLKYNLDFSQTNLAYPLKFTTVNPGDVYEFDDYKVTVHGLKHDAPSHAYHFKMNDRVGVLNIEKAVELGVPKGPLLGLLKKGEEITLENGVTVKPSDVIGETIKGKSVLICGDSRYEERFESEFPKDLDVLVYEGTLNETETDEVLTKYMHSTFQQASLLGKKINAKQTYINHISARYLNAREIQGLVQEINENALIVKDYDSFKI